MEDNNNESETLTQYTGIRKWEWLVSAIIIIVIGLGMILISFYLIDLLLWELFLLGIALIISGIVTIIYRKTVVLL